MGVLTDLETHARHIFDQHCASGPIHVESGRAIGPLIDYTRLRADTASRDIDRLCDDAVRHQFAAVCVNPCWVDRALERTSNSGVRVVSVVAFPLGCTNTAAKVAEARLLVAHGVHEVDMVAPLGHMLDGDWEYVEEDIRSVVEAVPQTPIKVIVETALHGDPLVTIKAGLVVAHAGARFVKTSTGFDRAGGATVETVALLRAAVGSSMGVKASGGIRDLRTACSMVRAGADRIGTSTLMIAATGDA